MNPAIPSTSQSENQKLPKWRFFIFILSVLFVAIGGGYLASWFVNNYSVSLADREILTILAIIVAFPLFLLLYKALGLPVRNKAAGRKSLFFLIPLLLIVQGFRLWVSINADRAIDKFARHWMDMKLDVTDFRDEPLITANNHLIGVRISFRVRFPEAAPALSRDEILLWPKPWFDLGKLYVLHKTVEPPLSQGKLTIFKHSQQSMLIVKPEVDYRVTADMVPHYFVESTEKGTHCLDESPYTYTSKQSSQTITIPFSERLATMSKQKPTKFGFYISAQSYGETKREYLPMDFYNGALAEVGKKCGPEDLKEHLKGNEKRKSIFNFFRSR